ncbi:MAG: hypothetical protein C5B43_01965, partial [Verrucomicrobia bacterium]
DTFLAKFDLITNGGQGFSQFDTLLVDDHGNKIVNTKNYKLQPEDLLDLEDTDNLKKIYLPLNKNGKKCLVSLNGMDLSHLNSKGNYLMAPSSKLGPAQRHWSEIERQTLEALGYKLKPAKKYSWVWKVSDDDDTEN